MAQKTNRFERFWKELKRRKVFGVVTTYTATAYIIIEVTNNLSIPLHLPDWFASLEFIILLIGLPIVIILAWIFDFTPRGIERTEFLEESGSKKNIIKPIKTKLRASYVINAVLLIAVIVLAYPKIFPRDTLEKLRLSGARISVAVMPFQNLTNDSQKNFWQEMIQDNLITSLSNTEELTIRQPESILRLLQNNEITNYASITPSIASNISQKLEANIFINGSINQIGTVIRLNAKLIDSETEELFKSFQIDGTEDNILNIADSLSVMIKDFLIISKLIKEGNPAVVKFEATTKIPGAFRFVISGNNAFFGKMDFPSAINLYMKAFSIDSGYFYPVIMISYSYWNQYLYQEGKKWCLKAYEKRDQLPELIRIYANILHAMYFETPYESIKYQKQLLEIDDQLPDIYTDIGFDYNRLGQYSKAIPELEKALDIYKKWGITPLWSVNYTNLGIAYHETGQYGKEKALYKKAEKYFNDDLNLTYRQCILELTEGDTTDFNKYIEKAIRIAKEESWTDVNIAAQLATGFAEVGKNDKAEEYYRKALSFEPGNPDRMNDLAFLLIDSNRSLPEGMELVEKALESTPDNYKYLDCKGWGLYKQGKYNEALIILQKSWDLRKQYAVYNHAAFLHLEAAKKAVAGMK